MSAQRHRIGRQTIEIVLPGKDDLPSLRQRIGELYETLLLPEMERIFSDLSGPETVTRFERIELDLGVIPLPDLDTALCDRLGSSLRAEIQRRTGQTVIISKKEKFWQSRGMGGETVLLDGPELLDRQALRRELLLHFLDRGTFPWWAEEKSSRTIENILLHLTDLSSGESSSLLQEAISRDVRRMRLINQVPYEILGRIAVILGAPEREMRTWIAQLDRFPGLSDDLFMPLDCVRFAFWEAVLAALLHSGPISVTGENFIASLLRILARVAGHPVDEFVRRLQHALGDLSYVGPSAGDQAERTSRGAISSAEDMTGVTEEQAVVQQGGSTASSIVAGGGPESLPMTQWGENTGQQAESRYFVENAGLVILWPYLGSFFARCDLLREGAFSDDASAMQAVTLLQYLVDGEQEPGEQHLTLNKVLCGWPLNRPLCRFIPFPAGATEESDRLLQSVIGHWSILKDTSPRGLRESFLQRKGILCDDDTSWVLRVERRSYDMLLDYLPWGITMVHLSWMTKPLIVQW